MPQAIVPFQWLARLKKNPLLRAMNLHRVAIGNRLYLRRLKTPSVLFIFITSRCNACCRHCFYWKQLKTKEDMQLENYVKIISSLKNRLNTLILTGGEPTLHPQLNRFVEFALNKNNPRIIALPTNGMLTKPVIELADRFCLDYPGTFFDISFSLDGLQQTHDQIRGVPGSFEKTVATITALVKFRDERKPDNLGINVVTTIGDHNFRQVEDLFLFVKQHFPVQHKIQLLRGSTTGVFGIGPQQISDMDPLLTTNFSRETLADLRATVSRVQQTFAAPPLQQLKLSVQLDALEGRPVQMKCVAGINDGVIYQNGDVAICEMLKPLANLQDFQYDFAKLWNSKKVRNYIRTLHCHCIHNCNIVSNMKYDFPSMKKLWDWDNTNAADRHAACK